MSINQWFYVEAESSKGPIAEAELAELIHKGALSQASLVWREGMTNWSAANEVAELKSLFNQFIRQPESPAPIQLQHPPTIETQVQSFQENSQPVNSPSIPERDWHYAIGSQPSGPISSEILRQKIIAGEFSPENTLIWHEGMANWTVLKEVTELNHLLTQSQQQYNQRPIMHSSNIQHTEHLDSIYQSGLVRDISTHSGQLNEYPEHYTNEQPANVEAQPKTRLNSRLLGSPQQQVNNSLSTSQDQVKMVRPTSRLFYWLGICQLGWTLYRVFVKPDAEMAIIDFIFFAAFCTMGFLGRTKAWAYITGMVLTSLLLLSSLMSLAVPAIAANCLFLFWLTRGFLAPHQEAVIQKPAYQANKK